MNRFEVVEAAIAAVANGEEQTSQRRRQGLLGLLREASVTIDSLWHCALRDGPDDMAYQLGEASHAVHRALIALTPPATDSMAIPA